ncbi:hypothetical protein NIES4101_57280 [Calothrix sp. NIES-4101]|nr:hypothetical protein NIES4101_57280 [Calothrix sp. NIES-4101]
MPEFLIDMESIPGIPVGRLYVPYAFTSKPKQLITSHQPVLIYREKHYSTKAQLIQFVAPISEYSRLVSYYSHHRHAKYTSYLLSSASTFFRGLKPPYLNDDEYLC